MIISVDAKNVYKCKTPPMIKNTPNKLRRQLNLVKSAIKNLQLTGYL